MVDTLLAKEVVEIGGTSQLLLDALNDGSAGSSSAEMSASVEGDACCPAVAHGVFVMVLFLFLPAKAGSITETSSA
jgi:hypothetical protein